MKNLLKIAAAFVLLVGLYSCDTQPLQDAIDDFVVLIGLEEINTYGLIQVLDAETGELVTGNMNVTFTPPAGGDIIDMFSDPVSSVSISNGIITYGISNDIVPTEDNPVSFSVRIDPENPSYRAKTFQLNLADTGQVSFIQRIVNRSNPPQGVYISTKDAGAADATTGALAQEVVVEATSEVSEGQVPTTVTIPSGTVLIDEQGNPLSGELTAETEFYDTSTWDGLNALPNEVQKTLENENIVPFGITITNVSDRSGRKAVRVGGGATKTTEPNGSIVNEPVVLSFNLNGMVVEMNDGSGRFEHVNYPGNPIYIHHMDEEGNLTSFLVHKDDERFSFTTEKQSNLDHSIQNLSAINFSWDVLDIGVTAAATTFGLFATSLKYEMVLEIDRNGNTGPISYQALSSGGSLIQPSSGVLTGNRIEFSNININETVTVTFANDLGTFQNIVLDDVVFNFTLNPPPSNTIDARINVSVLCPGIGQQISVTSIEGAVIMYRKQGAPSGTEWTTTNFAQVKDPSTGALVGGTILMNGVEQGETYEFKVIYDNDELSLDVEDRTVTITGTSINKEIQISSEDGDICQ